MHKMSIGAYVKIVWADSDVDWCDYGTLIALPTAHDGLLHYQQAGTEQMVAVNPFHDAFLKVETVDESEYNFQAEAARIAAASKS